MSSQPRWALITGVSEGGIGDALTTQFLARGVSVIASSLNLKLLDYLPKEPRRLEHVQLDVTSADSISVAVKQVEAITGGKLDFLVNNAGYGYMASLLDAPIAKVKAEYEVNVFGLLAVTQAFFPLLKEANGMVVNQSSIAGLRSGCQPFIGAYSSSKAAVTAMSNTMRVEFEPFGVKVVTLITGDVTTTFWKSAQTQGCTLSETSLYAPLKDKLEAVMRGETRPPGGHSRDVWAKRVVNDLLKANPSAYVRRGFLATIIWMIGVWVPWWMLDYGFSRASDLGKLKKIVQEEEQKRSD